MRTYVVTAVLCAGALSCSSTLSTQQPRAYQCSQSSDCAGGWRCGLSGFCHDEEAGAPYACINDLDCERGWRCAFAGACVDPSSEALVPPASPPVLSEERLGPAIGDAPFLAVSAFGQSYAFPVTVVTAGDAGLRALMFRAPGATQSFPSPAVLRHPSPSGLSRWRRSVAARTATSARRTSISPPGS